MSTSVQPGESKRPSFQLVNQRDVAKVEILPGLHRQVLVSGDHLMTVLFTLTAGYSFPPHSHHNDQAGFVLDGEIDWRAGSKQWLKHRGTAYFTYSHQVHGAQALRNAQALDIFSPPRLDFLPGSKQASPYGPGAAPPPAPTDDDRPIALESAEVPKVERFPGVFCQRLLAGTKVMTVLVTMNANKTFPAIRLRSERAGYIVSGAVDVIVDGTRHRATEGCSFLAPEGSELSLESPGETEVLFAVRPEASDLSDLLGPAAS